MDNQPHIIPAVAVKSAATGLIMMSFFTVIWAFLAFNGMDGSSFRLVLIVFPLLCIAFIISAIRLYGIAKYFPKLTTAADIAEGKRMRRWYGIIFAGEGLGIFIAINVVINIGHPELTMPVIALVVGLHFFPLAKVFKRTIDYYIGAWSTIIAICCILFTLNKTYPPNTIFVILGVGLSMATSCYGIFMVSNGRRMAKTAVIS